MNCGVNAVSSMSLLDVFFRHAKAQPDAVAVRFDEQAITYAELAARSLSIGKALRNRGIGPDVVVGLHARRSTEYITSILGIFVSGGACLPLDPSYPAARLRLMATGSGAALLLRDSEVGDSLDPDIPEASISELAAGGGLDGLPSDGPHDGHLAYVLYTSGSTGTPKGVAMEHGPLRRLIEWQLRQDEGAGGATLQFAQLGFDVAFQEILSALCSGGGLVIADEKDRRDPAKLAHLIAHASIARLFLPTAYLPLLAETARKAPPAALRHIHVAGEALKITPVIREFMSRAPWCSLHNHYGPTETHVVTSYTLPSEPATWPSLPPIGTALPHATIHIRDEAGRPIPRGDVGEICIAGACLARGYVGQSEQNAARFAIDAASGMRIYRTGDLACEVDGLLHYRGRMDRQVKIRGYRVEPDEIEATLAGHENVAEAAVTTESNASGHLELVAYAVLREPALGVASCRSFLREKLPEFMVPAVWIDLPALARTPSGKIDRRALTKHRQLEQPVRVALSACTPAEQLVAEIWRRVLPSWEAGLDDKFFDAGGNSILFVHMQAALQAELGVTVPITALYENVTIRLLARWIETHAGAAADAVIATARPVRAVKSDTRAVAVVGLACRFPGATGPAQFWSNLCNGVDSIAHAAPANTGGPAFVAAAGKLPDIEAFDAAFFGFSKRDADLLDPQHRLFLECAHDALEDAAIDSRRLGGRIGVFGGCGPSTYLLNNLLPALGGEGARNLIGSVADLQLLIANDKDYVTSQVSYRLDLKGPSINVNAACATALAAVHFASRSLLAGECEAALAGAANIPVPQLQGYVYEPGMVFSPDGYCRAFDEEAAGTVFGSGVGVVALRRLDDALRDGDDIYAVIRGSAFGNDGGLKAGFTAPSEEGQARVIREALDAAGLDPDRVGFIEAHGTATPVGDAIEVAALRRVFAASGARRRALGSVKTNVGHLGWAAGMAGLLKTVLALRHRKIPPTLHFSRPNPALQLEASGFFVNTGVPCEWPSATGPLCAGVSAFGLGGASAHVVIEEAPARAMPEPATRSACTVPLSARNAQALAALGASYAACLSDHPEIDLADIAFTASTGRRHHAARKALVARTRDDLIAQLKNLTRRGYGGRASAPVSARIAGLFTGQGAERLGMGRQLYATEPVFRKVMDCANAQMLSEYRLDLLSWLFEGPADDFSARIDRIQPAVFSLEMALVALWRSWGVRFDATIGHSLGEFAAAATAGVFGFEDGLRLVAERGRLLKSLSDDAAMAVVFADETNVREAIGCLATRTWVAAVNSEFNTVISGTKVGVADACAAFAAKGIEARLINVSRAGHSALMEPIRAAFEDAASQISMRPPQIDFASNVTGALGDADVTTPEYWGRHLCETVRFAAGLYTIARRGVDAFVELGAAPHLISIAEASLPDTTAAWLASMRPGEDENEVLARSAGGLYEAGFDLDWTSLQDGSGRRVHLPGYPFQRTRHWVEAPVRPDAIMATGAARQIEVDENGFNYQIEWQPVPTPARPPTARAGHWLLFSDQSGVARTLAREVRAENIGATLIISGERCGWGGEGEFVIRPGSNADLGQLFAAHATKDITGIISFWSLDTFPPRTDEPDADLPKAVRRSLELALMLAQRAPSLAGSATLAFVTRGAQRVRSSDDELDPLQSAIWGFARTAALEIPDARFLRIDIAPREDVDGAALLAALALGGSEPELALRDGRLFASRLARKISPAAAVLSLRPEASYLVTGGLGGLGLWSAQQLVRHGARRLVLVGRSAPKPSTEAAIEALHNLGVKVAVVEADIAAPAVATRLFKEAERSGAPIRGIIHCAGVIDDETIERQNWQRIEAVLRPKMQGAWNLHAAAAAQDGTLDFFLLQSSATSVLGNFGQAGHGAACAFLDGLAQHRRQLGEPAMSVNWGAWSDIGYLTSRPEIVGQLERRGMGSIAAATGARLLPALVSSCEAQWAVLPNDWNVYLDYQSRAGDPFFGKIGAGAGQSEMVDLPVALRLARAAPQMRRAALLAFLREETQRLLGAGASVAEVPLDADCPLRDLGLDSLGAIQLRNILQSRLKVRLPPRLVYENPTISALVDHLLREVVTDAWCEAVSARTADETPPGLPAAAGRAHDNEAVRLSVQQRRWLRLIRDVDYGQRVVPIVFHAALDRRAFLGALKCVIGRHDVLRYVFPEDRALALAPERLVQTPDELFVDIRGLSSEGRLTEVRRQIGLCRSGLGDPTNHPSWSLRCLESTPSQFIVLLGLQHLAFDGTSLSVFIDELREAYLAETAGRAPNLPAMVTQYREYAEQQRAFMENGIAVERAFFEGLYAALEGTTALGGHPGFATTRARPSQRFTAEAPLADWSEVSEAARRLGASPFALLMSSYATLVGEMASRGEVVIGVIASGRGDARFNRTIGPFTSPFPVPITLGRDPAALARRVDRLMAGITARSMYPAVDLTRYIDAFKGFPLDTYFTDTCINFLNYRREEQSPALSVEVLEILGPVSHPEFADCGFDQLRRIPGFHLVADVWEGTLRANYWYHTERFDAVEIGEWAARHRAIMTSMVASCGIGS